MALAFVLAGAGCCRTANTEEPATPAARAPSVEETGEDLIGKEVTARVEKLEYKAQTEDLSDGSVLVYNLVTFGVMEPRSLRYVVVAHSQGLPAIGDRPLKLGDAVVFVLPKDWRIGDTSLSELKGLRFRE